MRRRRLLLALPALQEALSPEFRRIKYSLFPPLSLLTVAGLTPEDEWDVAVRDEHVESVELEEHFDVVGMTVYIPSAHRAYELAAHYRARGAKVVLGGIHPSTMPAEAAQHADAVCVGPAETVWPTILRDAARGRLRKFYRGRPAGSAALVRPARRDLMNPNAYLVRNTMVTSRGCPHCCSFCYKKGFWGEHYYESRPLGDIERELASLTGSFVFFLDDNFLGDRRHARRVFSVLKGSGLVWQASSSIDVVNTPGFLDEAYAAGCRSLFVGFESITPENMRRANKRINVAADYPEAIRRFHDAGIMVNGSFVFGFDHDDPDVFRRTLDFAIDSKLDTGTFHILTPYPGTAGFAQMAREGRLLHRDWSRYDTRHAVFRPRRMTPEQLEAGRRTMYREFYRYGSIFRRALGLTGALKRVAYNLAWQRMDPTWSALIGLGLLPAARHLFERILACNTRPAPRRAQAPAPAEGRIPRTGAASGAPL